MEHVRGKIRNRQFATQIRDMSGLCWGKITPTDIDAFLDFGGRVFVLVEAKHGNAQMPLGQRLALERLCDSCAKSGVETLLIVASHNTAGDIRYAELPVVQYRSSGRWLIPSGAITVRAIITEFLRRKRGCEG